MGLFKRMIERGLSGAESPPPAPEGQLPHDWFAAGDAHAERPIRPPTLGSPEAADSQAEDSAVDPDYELAPWRHPVEIERKELWESGFDFAGPKIEAAFAANGQSVRLTRTAGRLAVNDVPVGSDSDDFGYVEITHTGSGASFTIAEPTWALAVALHDAYLEPLDPDRSWQMGFIDGTTLLFLARPEEIDAIARRSSLAVVADLGQLSPR